MSEPQTAVAVTLTTSPIQALCQPEVTELVGLEDHGDRVRAYLGHRSRGVYVEMDADQADQWRTAWASGGHVWVYPIPPAEVLHREDPTT